MASAQALFPYCLPGVFLFTRHHPGSDPHWLLTGLNVLYLGSPGVFARWGWLYL